MAKTDIEEIKSRIKDAIAKMKTKSVDADGVAVTDEIKKRGRTDKVAKKKIEELQPEISKKLKLKESIAKKLMKKKIMEAREDAETAKLMKKLGIAESYSDIYAEEDDLDLTVDNNDTDTEAKEVIAEADEENTEENTEETTEENTNEESDEQNIEDEIVDETPTEETETAEEGTESEETTEDTESEENPEDKDAIFDSEEKLPDSEKTENPDDVDEIIHDLLESINVSVDYNNNKVEITGDDSTATTAEPTTEIDSFDFVDFDKEDSEDIDKSADEDVEEAEDEEEEMKESLNNLVKTFGDKYPKVFNESTLKALAEMVEKYSEAKAKVKSTKKIASIVKKVNTYMESVKAEFIKQNMQKLNEAVSLDRKEKVIKKIKALIERKMANDKASKLNESKTKKTIKILAMKNRRLESDVEKLSETNGKLKKILRKQNLMERKRIEAEKRKMMKEAAEKRKAEKMTETKTTNPVSIVRKPVRRSDRTLTLEGIKKAVINRKETKLTDEEIENLKNPTIETESIDMSQFEKYIYDNNK